jgi:hypothetical protein
VLQKEDSFQGDLELVARSEDEGEAIFIMRVRATNKAIAIINGMWVEIADRLVRFPALAEELEETQQKLAARKREYDDFTGLLLRLSRAPENKALAGVFTAEALRPLVAKLDALNDRMSLLEATASHADGKNDGAKSMS